MTEQNGGYGFPTPGDRLNALRSPTPPPITTTGHKKPRTEFIVLGAVCLILILLGGPFLRTRNKAIDLTTNQQLTDQVTEAIQSETGSSVLLDGDVLFGVAVKPGNYPAEMKAGDVVHAVLTPSITGGGDAKEIESRMTVVSIDASSEIGGDAIVTLSGPESVTSEIAMSGPIHLTIVEVGPK